MTTNAPAPFDGQTEYCDDCERDTEHAVQIEIRQEGDPVEDAVGFSREPYRVTTCRACGSEKATRMNDV
jgi:hypothetical protein